MFLFFTGAVLLGVALGSYLVYVPLLVFFCLILAAVILTIGERWGRLTIGEGAILYGALLGGVLLWAVSAWDGSGSLPASLEGQGPVVVVGLPRVIGRHHGDLGAEPAGSCGDFAGVGPNASHRGSELAGQ